jgi:hypothetical protein
MPPDVLELVKSGDNEKLQKCLLNGADVSRRDAGGCSALMRAAERGNVYAIELLIASNADLESKDNFGWTALICACRFGHVDAAAALIAANADLKAVDSLRATAETTAKKFGKHSEYAEAVRRAARLKALRLQKATHFDVLLTVMLARQRQRQPLVDDVPSASVAVVVARACGTVRHSGCAGKPGRVKEDADGVPNAALAAAVAALPSGLLAMVGEAMTRLSSQLEVAASLESCTPSRSTLLRPSKCDAARRASESSNRVKLSWPRSLVSPFLASCARLVPWPRARSLPTTAHT